MRLLVLHNGYRFTGGEDRQVENEVAMLRQAGHEVTVEILQRPVDWDLVNSVRMLAKAPFDPRRLAWMEQLLDRVRPDVVHIHNFFPQLTFAAHVAAHRRGVAVVQTLHNYRVHCAAATFERDGQVCELCRPHNRWPAVRHACFKSSRFATGAVVRMQMANDRSRLLYDHVDRFIALTAFARDKFVEGGFPAEKMTIKPNFHGWIDDPDPAARRDGALFVGRLSHEKGPDVLLDAWERLGDVPLTVLGDGPLLDTLRARAPRNVVFKGHVPPVEVEAHMRRAAALVVPSIWYEGMPLVIVEAFACGLPVLLSDIGSLKGLVTEGRNGGYFLPNDPASLAQVVSRFLSQPDDLGRMSRAARAEYVAKYSPADNLPLLENIYAAAMEVARERGTRVPPLSGRSD